MRINIAEIIGTIFVIFMLFWFSDLAFQAFFNTSNIIFMIIGFLCVGGGLAIISYLILRKNKDKN